MRTRNKWTIIRFELVGAAVMVVAGSMLHFAFDGFGGWRPAALIAAVNESVWEHLKLAFWPGIFWAALAPAPAGLRRADLLAAKGLTLLVTAVLIVAIFRSYTAILGRNLLPLDIGVFVLAILIGQALAVLLLRRKLLSKCAARRAGLSLIGAQLVAYSLFTFFPPEHWLFIETRSGLRGMPAP